MRTSSQLSESPRALDRVGCDGSGSAVDLSRYSDLDVLRIVGTERPQFVDIIAGEIDKGRTDEQIIRLVCDSGGSPQVMRYTQKCLRALRRLAALDALTAESQRMGLYEQNIKMTDTAEAKP